MIESSHTAGNDLVDDGLADFRFDARSLGKSGRQFQQVQGAPGIAIRRMPANAATCPSPICGSECWPKNVALRESSSALRRTRAPGHPFPAPSARRHAGARQQRIVEFERRVLGGRTDKSDRAVLDKRQEGILLRFIEPVHFVEKQYRRSPGLGAGLRHRGANILDAGHHRRQSDELGIRRWWRSGAPGWSCRFRAAPRESPSAGFRAFTSRVSGLPSPSRCAWPMISSNDSRPHPVSQRTQLKLRCALVGEAHSRESLLDVLIVGVESPII